MIKAGIFDVGGVLQVNSSSYINNDIVKTLGIAANALADGLNHSLGALLKGEISEQEFWKNFISYTNAPGRLPTESLFGREYKKRFKKNESVLSLVIKLKRAGYKTAVLSDTITPHADFNRKEGLYDNFDIEVLSNKVGMIKPDPQIFIYTLKKLHIAPDEAFFVDDLDLNVSTAIKLGIHGIKFNDYEQLEEDLKELGVNF